MQQLRDLYGESQQISREDPEGLTRQRCAEMLALANEEYAKMVANDDYQHLEEVIFYRDKFQQINDLHELAAAKGITKSNVTQQVPKILQENYAAQSVLRDQRSPKPRDDERRGNSLIYNFFNRKREEIEKSKSGFKSILETMPRSNKKFAIKSSHVHKPTIRTDPGQEEQLNRLKKELSRLQEELALRTDEKDENLTIYELEKQRNEKAVRNLMAQITTIQEENYELREKVNHNQYKPTFNYLPFFTPIEAPPSPSPTPTPISSLSPYLSPSPKYESMRFQTNPNNFMSNDMSKLKDKTNRSTSSIRSHSIQKSKSHQSISPPQQEFNQPSFQFTNPLLQSPHFIQSDFPQPASTEYLFKASNHKFNRSEVFDEAKNIAIRSKISFFKPSMIIYRGKEFEVAVKVADTVRLESKRISIYVHNRQGKAKEVSLSYKFDSSYHEVAAKKKMHQVGPHGQEREEVEVTVLNSYDFDSIVEVQLTVFAKCIQFLLPTMFLEFVEKRPLRNKTVTYAKARVNPIHQFSTLDLAQEIMPLEKIYDEPVETARVYAISKYDQGYIYLRWMHGQVQVETLGAWKLFVSYLLLKDY